MTSGQLSYDLRRLRAHGIIEKIPHTNSYRVITPTGIRHALFLTRLAQLFLVPGLAQLAGRDPTPPGRLRTASRAYESAINDLARQAALAA